MARTLTDDAGSHAASAPVPARTKRRFPIVTLGIGFVASTAAGLAIGALLGSVLLGLTLGWLLSPAVILACGYVLAPRRQEESARRPDGGT